MPRFTNDHNAPASADDIAQFHSMKFRHIYEIERPHVNFNRSTDESQSPLTSSEPHYGGLSWNLVC